MELTPQQVNEICKGDKEIAVFFHALLAQNQLLTQQVKEQAQKIETLEKRIHELERQLGQNSNNSSKPPSSDGFRKPTNLRTPGGKKGAPKGHKGHTLKFSEIPDEIITETPHTCSHCSASLQNTPSMGYEKRQVFDLPAPRVIVTEYRAEKVCCAGCGHITQAPFPQNVKSPTQYGQGFTTWTAYLHAYQMLPLKRIAQFFYDLTGCRPSEHTLLNNLKSMHHALAGEYQTIWTNLFQSLLLHCDETGVRTKAKNYWMHVISNAAWTLLDVHPKRGEGMAKIGILPSFEGKVVHDCFSTYFKDMYSFVHVLCNAHLLRECQGIAQHDKHQWASRMKELLQESWALTKAARISQKPLSDDVIEGIRRRYQVILDDGEIEWSQDAVREKTGTRGRKIKSKAANLGERFRQHEESILRFLWDEQVPFDNNQAERDLRMVKVKNKVSGTFRTEDGAGVFARIRSVISTYIKQDKPILESLKLALEGNLVLQ